MIYDGVVDFSTGMNSGLDPFIIPANQAAFLTNATVRGNFASDRPPYQRQLPQYPSGDVQTGIESGYFQGACYCAPDTGQQFIVTQIGGRLFKLTPSASSVAVAVEEITIPNDPNPANIAQAWLKQAERWVIVQNGINNPIFYDSGTDTARRSIPVSAVQAYTQFGTVSNQFVTPIIGGTISILLDSAKVNNITNFIGEAVQFVEYDENGAVTATTSYKVISVGGAITTYNMTLTNLSDTAGAVVNAGTAVVVQPSSVGVVSRLVSAVYTDIIGKKGDHAVMVLGFPTAVPSTVAIGALLIVTGDPNWKVTDVNSIRTQVTLKYQIADFNPFTAPSWVFPVGTNVYIAGSSTTPTTVAVTSSNFTAPAVGVNVTFNTQARYTGAVGQIVYLNNKQYKVVSSNTVTSSGSNTLTVENLNDSRFGHIFNAITTAPSTLATQIWNFPELPPGRMMEYSQGRVSLSLPDGISFIIGDIVGGASGSPDFNYRDAVLKASENALIAGGGSFKVPSNLGQIAAMRTTAQLDASLGQGPLMVVTPGGVFSCNAPADRTLWQSLTSPIVSESLIGLGGLSQESTVVVNGDLLFRAVDGIRSLIMAKREFFSWGNTPISFEMNRVLTQDDVSLLPYASAVQFDNRLLMTCTPQQGPNGVFFSGLISLNFDPVSSLQGKGASVYDGLWQGLNVLQLVEGQFNGVDRCFAFVYNTATFKTELWEISKTGEGYLDNSLMPIVWGFETPVMLKGAKGKELFDLCALEGGEFFVKDIQPGQTISFTVEYRPDFATPWYPWYAFQVTNPNADVSYGAGLGLPRPKSGISNRSNTTSTNMGRWFQVRFTISGHCVFMGLKVGASWQPKTEFERVIPSTP
jgi:uncharacterized membrane protein